MSISVKKSGSYAAPASIFVKKGGVYAAVAGIFAKIAGAYQRVDGNRVGGDRLLSNEKYATGNSGVKNAVYKDEAEAPYSAVYLWIGSKTTSGTQAVYQAYAASTEEGRVDTSQHQFAPYHNGTINDTLTNVPGDGYSQFTWGGQTSVTIPLITDQGTGQNLAGFTRSDRLPKNSIARADVAGGRPMCISRVQQTMAGAGFPSSSSNTNATNWHAGRGQSWYREHVCNAVSSAALNTYPSFVANQGDVFYCWLEFEYTVPVRNVLVVGDSREASASSLYEADSWHRRALKGLSTTDHPIGITNVAGSGHSQTQFLAMATNILNAGWTGTDVLLPGFSQNGFNQNDAGASYIAAIDAFVNVCLNKGLRVLMTTDYGATYTTGSNAEVGRLNCIAHAKALAAQGKVTLVDTDALITDYTAAQPGLKAIYNTNVVSNVEGAPGSGDGIHAGPTGQNTQMAPALAAVF